MGKLFIIRHTETEWNKKHIFTGWEDISISNHGIEQAKKMKKYFEDIKIDYVISSPMKRCIETYEIVLEDQKEKYEVIYKFHLIERCYGVLEGKSKLEVLENDPFAYNLIFHRGYFEGPPLGESFKDVEKRIILFLNWLNQFLKDKKEKNILICAHGNSIRLLLKVLEHLSIEKTCSLNISQEKPYIYDFYYDEDGLIKFKKIG